MRRWLVLFSATLLAGGALAPTATASRLRAALPICAEPVACIEIINRALVPGDAYVVETSGNGLVRVLSRDRATGDLRARDGRATCVPTAPPGTRCSSLRYASERSSVSVVPGGRALLRNARDRLWPIALDPARGELLTGPTTCLGLNGGCLTTYGPPPFTAAGFGAAEIAFGGIAILHADPATGAVAIDARAGACTRGDVPDPPSTPGDCLPGSPRLGTVVDEDVIALEDPWTLGVLRQDETGRLARIACVGRAPGCASWRTRDDAVITSLAVSADGATLMVLTNSAAYLLHRDAASGTLVPLPGCIGSASGCAHDGAVVSISSVQALADGRFVLGGSAGVRTLRLGASGAPIADPAATCVSQVPDAVAAGCSAGLARDTYAFTADGRSAYNVGGGSNGGLRLHIGTPPTCPTVTGVAWSGRAVGLAAPCVDANGDRPTYALAIPDPGTRLRVRANGALYVTLTTTRRERRRLAIRATDVDGSSTLDLDLDLRPTPTVTMARKIEGAVLLGRTARRERVYGAFYDAAPIRVRGTVRDVAGPIPRASMSVAAGGVQRGVRTTRAGRFSAGLPGAFRSSRIRIALDEFAGTPRDQPAWLLVAPVVDKPDLFLLPSGVVSGTMRVRPSSAGQHGRFLVERLEGRRVVSATRARVVGIRLFVRMPAVPGLYRVRYVPSIPAGNVPAFAGMSYRFRLRFATVRGDPAARQLLTVAQAGRTLRWG